jgi:type II secretion system protein D
MQPGQPGANPQGENPNGPPGERNGPRRGGPGDVPALIANLRGEVSVESVPDLGVLILRGNDQDVQAVMDVIRTLENLSAGQQPVVELLRLEHVDSAALSTLLTSVYEQLARVRNRGEQAPTRIAVMPVVKPNAVIVVAPEGEIESVLDLASELDQPVDPATEFQVFPLRHATAEQAATTITTFYEERAGLGARITVTPDIRTNSLIVSARPRDLEEIEQLIRRIDTNESGSVSQLRIFPLRSASAEELTVVINQAIQSAVNPAAAQTTTGQGGFPGGAGAAAGTGQAAQQLRAARSVVLEFLDKTPEGARLLKSGLLSDIRITADPRTNSLLVSATEPSLPLIEALIRALDRPAAAVSEIKMFTLENTDATTAAELLDSLFGTGTQQQGGGIGGARNAATGIQLAGTAGTGSSLIPLKFAVDTRTNSVVATGSADALRVVEAILIRLDESDIRQRETTVIKLKNAPAANVAESIQMFLTSQRELLQINENLVSTTELLEREIIVVPEPVSNSLLLSTTPRFYDQIRRVIAKLDEAPPQVIIQAMLVEVSLDNTDEFGIELGFQDSTLFDRSIGTANDVLQTLNVTNTSPNGVATTTNQVVTRSATPGFLFNNTGPLGNNVGIPGNDRVGTQGLSNFSLGRSNADLGYGGFVFSASSANVSVLLRALSAKRTVQILSRPQIRTLDNQLAQVQVGQNVPVVTGASISGIQTIPIIERLDAGLILTVTPRISPDGQVVMEVAAERSEFTGAGVPVFVNATTGDTVESPIKDITTARATVSVPTGQTIVMGGIITRNDDTIERKVPYVGDIPYLGQLFRYDSTRTVRRELLIFLTPRVIYNDADNELIKQVETDRLHYIEHEAEKIHGPLYAVPPAGPIAPPEGAPPVLPPGAIPPAPVLGAPDGLPPEAEVLPGLPAEACPPGLYPPGTLYDGYPVIPPVGPPQGTPAPQDGPPNPMPPDAVPTTMVPPPAPAAPNGAVMPAGHAVATGRLAGRTVPAKPVTKKRGLLSRN